MLIDMARHAHIVLEPNKKVARRHAFVLRSVRKAAGAKCHPHEFACQQAFGSLAWFLPRAGLDMARVYSVAAKHNERTRAAVARVIQLAGVLKPMRE